MVFVSFMDEFPWQLDDDALAVPLDVGRWALIRGGTPHLRRRVAADLRALSRGPAGALTVRLARTLGAATTLEYLERTSTLTFAGGFTT